jgi:NadR type nicotinamide-nucleotide adenylyltransferase
VAARAEGGDVDARLQPLEIDGLAKVVLYGPESTGKTTLAHQLTDRFKAIEVGEYARGYIMGKLRRGGRNCCLDDILTIAAGQQDAENRLAARAGRGILICDTDLLTIKAYSDLFFGGSPAELEDALPDRCTALYLLTDIDVPWQADGVRDRPSDRARSLAYFEHLLQIYDRTYVKISGNPEQRRVAAIQAVEDWLSRR